MATDTPKGMIRYFEDFVGWDIVADHPEVAVDTDPAVEVVAEAVGGVVRITCDAGQVNIGGIGFGQEQWDISNYPLTLEARVRLSAIGTADERVFLGFVDTQADTLSEFPFTIATTTLTAVADPDDAIGFVWEGNATNASWYPASQNADTLVIDGVTNVASTKRRPPVANTWQTLSMSIKNDGKFVEFAVNGEIIYTYTGSTAAIADVPLWPVFMATEGTTAINVDIDYIEITCPRPS